MGALTMPLSADELRESVRQSRAIDPGRLSRVLRVDARRGLIEVQAGTPWTAIADALRPGDARARAVSAPRRTVGESLAWNAAGPDGRPVVRHVDSLALVTPDGQLRRVDRMTNPSLFGLVIGGQGLFGALYSATLRIDSLARAVSEAPAPETLARAPREAPAATLRLLVPPERVEALCAEVRACAAEWRLAIDLLGRRLIRAEDETFLPWAPREYVQIALAVGAATCLGHAVRATQVCRELIGAALAHGGAFPIACTTEATRAQTEACYPRLAAFLAEQRRIDPEERMANGWLRHYRSLLTRESCAVRWSR